MSRDAPPVVIDFLPARAARYRDGYAIVAVDVIRATTLAITAVAAGRRCLVARDLDDAFALRDATGAILAGELRGVMPPGFDMNNSPAELASHPDADRPLVMLSTSGTELMLEAARATLGSWVASFRNITAVARATAAERVPVAVIGAGSRGEFREEDQMACAWIADRLLDAGYRSQDATTMAVIERWRGVPAEACGTGNSVAYLRRTDQMRDYDFILEHVDDLDLACRMEGNAVVALPTAAGVPGDGS